MLWDSKFNYGRVVDSCDNDETILRILPTQNYQLQDELFCIQITTGKYDNKQISIKKFDIDTIIDALQCIRNDLVYYNKELDR